MVDGVVAALGGADCEVLRSGWLAQPANAVSSAAFVVVGARLVWASRRPGVHRTALAAGGAGMIAVGLGSVAYHGPQPGWARLAHDGSIAVLVLLGAVLFGATAAQGRVTSSALAAWRRAALWMGLAVAAFVSGRTGGWLCDPATPWQPHALWHVLSSVGLGWAVFGCAQLRATEPSLQR